MHGFVWLMKPLEWLLPVVLVAAFVALSPFLALGCVTYGAAVVITTMLQLNPSRIGQSVCLIVSLPLLGVAAMLWWTGLGMMGMLPWLVGLSTGIGATVGVVKALTPDRSIFKDEQSTESSLRSGQAEAVPTP